MFKQIRDHFRRQKIERQEHLVEMLEEAYCNHPMQQYLSHLQNEQLVLQRMRERWKL